VLPSTSQFFSSGGGGHGSRNEEEREVGGFGIRESLSTAVYVSAEPDRKLLLNILMLRPTMIDAVGLSIVIVG
jgi:hypothetical protein